LVGILLGAYIVARIGRMSVFYNAIVGGAHSAQPHIRSPYGWYAAPAVVCWMVCTATELLLARRHAESYAPHGLWTWMRTLGATQAARRALSGFDRKLTSGAGYVAPFVMAAAGLLFVICGTLTAAAPLTPWLFAVFAFTAVYLFSVRRRWTGDPQF
jgi:hypothetical protein